MGTATNVTTPSLGQQITDAELAVVGPTLVNFLTTLESPSVNFLTVLQAAKNVQLQVLTLDAPAQAVFINLVASFLKAKLVAHLPTITPPAA
jgi:hypothetical protein